MGVFQVFQTVKMVPNRATHHLLTWFRCCYYKHVFVKGFVKSKRIRQP